MGRGDFAVVGEGFLVSIHSVKLVEVVDHEPGGLS
jgi:hypothetical protein